MAKKAKCNQSEAPEARMGVVEVALASHLEAAKLPQRPLLCRRPELVVVRSPSVAYCTVTAGHAESSHVMLATSLPFKLMLGCITMDYTVSEVPVNCAAFDGASTIPWP